MSDLISKTYNKISDVFSRSQVKKAVEGLHTYQQRVKLIDHIIDRRQEIRNADDIAKIQQYAHIFKKMLRRYKKKKDEDNEQEKAKLKMEMVMQLFRGEKKKQTQNYDQEQLKKQQLAKSRRNALPQQKQQQQQHTQSTKVEDSKMFETSPNRNKKLNRFFTEKDPMQVEKQVEQEIYDFLQKNHELDQVQKDRFLRLTDKSQQIRYIESKVKHQLVLQENQQQQMAIKQHYQVKNLFRQKNNRGHTQIKLAKSFQGKLNDFKIEGPLTSRRQINGEDSFASYTEIKLNKLYQESSSIQKTIKTKTLSCPTNQIQNYLIHTNRDIIDISNKKLFHIQKFKL
ncbi:unnamed protein product [Paramecium pentaurelia]|uniref:Uncharacterized protein n=1 Tax=Paramecium pentaurelia TaxID=43138 RepID=A0A8S1VUN7_9CILI|nr:unnamed protein product [Paramecium pentaurelia]